MKKQKDKTDYSNYTSEELTGLIEFTNETIEILDKRLTRIEKLVTFICKNLSIDASVFTTTHDDKEQPEPEQQIGY